MSHWHELKVLGSIKEWQCVVALNLVQVPAIQLVELSADIVCPSSSCEFKGSRVLHVWLCIKQCSIPCVVLGRCLSAVSAKTHTLLFWSGIWWPEKMCLITA